MKRVLLSLAIAWSLASCENKPKTYMSQPVINGTTYTNDYYEPNYYRHNTTVIHHTTNHVVVPTNTTTKRYSSPTPVSKEVKVTTPAKSTLLTPKPTVKPFAKYTYSAPKKSSSWFSRSSSSSSSSRSFFRSSSSRSSSKRR